MTGNYVYTSRYQDVLANMLHDLTNGELSLDMVRNVLITPEGHAVFEVYYFDHAGHKIRLYDVDSDWYYSPTYYYRVTPVDATISW